MLKVEKEKTARMRDRKVIIKKGKISKFLIR